MNNLNTIEQLVPVFTGTINGKPVQVCDARALHAYLENGKQFADWIKVRIEKYGFEANIDYLQVIDSSASLNNEASKSKSYGQGRIDYHLTLNMAKELGMVENNIRGREIRRYFIEMEQKALGTMSNATVIQKDNPAALRSLADASNTLASAANALADIARTLAAKYEPCVATTNTTQVLPIKPVTKSTDLSPISPREQAFIHGWWECFGNKTVTASDLYRAISTRQCQILNDSSGALLGDIELWTAKKLGYALRRWSQLNLDGYRVQNIGKSSHGITWRLELLGV